MAQKNNSITVRDFKVAYVKESCRKSQILLLKTLKFERERFGHSSLGKNNYVAVCARDG